MNDCRMAILENRGVLAISGEDAVQFLHGLVTQNIQTMQDNAAEFTALLTPQGKILFDFFIIRRGGEFLLDCARDSAADLAKRLTFYKLRAKVDVADRSDELAVAAMWGEGAAPQGADVFSMRDPRLDALGLRLIGAADAIRAVASQQGCQIADEAAYDAHRIGLGVPEGSKDFALGDAFPHDACMDQLNGVDFGKGCFVGQEVVSRMRHRGTARKRFLMVAGDAPLPEAGTPVVGDDSAIGTLGSSAGDQGLALVRIDRAAEALEAGTRIMAGDVSVTLSKPDWATFEFPQAVS